MAQGGCPRIGVVARESWFEVDFFIFEANSYSYLTIKWRNLPKSSFSAVDLLFSDSLLDRQGTLWLSHAVVFVVVHGFDLSPARFHNATLIDIALVGSFTAIDAQRAFDEIEKTDPGTAGRMIGIELLQALPDLLSQFKIGRASCRERV